MSQVSWCHPYFDLARPFIESWKQKNPEWNAWKDDDKLRRAIGINFVPPELAERHRKSGRYVVITDEEVIAWARANWMHDGREPEFAPSDENTVLVVMEVTV